MILPAARSLALKALQARLALKGLVGLAMFLFISGGVCSGLVFLSRTTSLLDPWLANRQHARVTSEQLRQAGLVPVATVQDVPADQAAVPGRSTSDPRFAFLLLGYGGIGHEGAYLTDSIVVAIANPEEKTITLLSLPRDIWTPLLFDGKTGFYHKLNTAYAFSMDASLYPDRLDRYTGQQGPGTFVMDTASRLLGRPISYYFALDFAGFRQMIDAVGGIDIDVPIGFVARYPANDDPEIDPTWTHIRFNAGLQRMYGERAIQYARAREVIDDSGEAGDFARSRRQRLIMEAFKDALLQPNGLLAVPKLMTIASSHVDTNYTIPAIADISQLALDWKNVTIYQTAITTNNYLEEANGPGGMYVLVPSTPDHSWSQVRAFVNHLWENPPLGVEMASTKITIVNATGRPGVATRVGAVLTQLGYQVGALDTAATRRKSRLIDRTDGEAELIVQQLRHDLGIDLPLETSRQVGTVPTLVLEIGSDDVGLADLVVPVDEKAPSSAYGLQSIGSWIPEVADTPTRTPTRSATQPSETGTPAGTTTPAATASPADTAGPADTPSPATSTTPDADATSIPAATSTPGTVDTPVAETTPTPAATAPAPAPTREAEPTEVSAPTASAEVTPTPAAVTPTPEPVTSPTATG